MKFYARAILPRGFKAGGVASGIKRSGKLDLALFYSEVPCLASGKFTTNSMAAAPVQLDKKTLQSHKVFRAIIANSGNANAYTGVEGVHDARLMAQLAARALSIEDSGVLVASTGIIGRRLPVEKIKKALPGLAAGLSAGGIAKAKQAIKTTDKFTKEITAKFTIGSDTVTVCGIAKGAGMIAPRMATMLVFIFTDAVITQAALDRALGAAVGNSFNCITVDGCMSTNDSVILLANKAAGNSCIDLTRNFTVFLGALQSVCLSLAKMIVRDGEGATKLISISVKGAKTGSDAKKIALTVASSNLFKTAMFASSRNIVGRIVAGVGASGAGVKEKDLSIRYSPLKKKEVDISIGVGKGKGKAVIYTSDLSFEYVKINAEYN